MKRVAKGSGIASTFGSALGNDVWSPGVAVKQGTEGRRQMSFQGAVAHFPGLTRLSGRVCSQSVRISPREGLRSVWRIIQFLTEVST